MFEGENLAGTSGPGECNGAETGQARAVDRDGLSGKEALRQDYIGRVADVANQARPQGIDAPDRAECRAAFRQTVDAGKYDMIITDMRYAVHNEAEFRAYWYTLIDSAASEPLEFTSSGALKAWDDLGDLYELVPMSAFSWDGTPIPLSWEFLSTDLSETSLGTLGTEVIFTDGHVEYFPYPSEYPAVWSVAELSHLFVLQNP